MSTQTPAAEPGAGDVHNDKKCTIAWLVENEVKCKHIPFTISANYTNWKPREAFRELVQNWYVPFVLTLLPTSPVPYHYAISFLVLTPN